MGNVLLAPHDDDETLFASFTCLREKPKVIVVLRSFVQEQRGYGITWQQREAETEAAMAVLGCEWEHWSFPDSAPPWHEIRERIRGLDCDHVYAPAIEQGGHEHHDALGEIVRSVVDNRRLTHYLTYTRTGGRSTSSRAVPYEPAWVALKVKALACYESQAAHPSTCEHFLYPQREFYAL